MCVSARVSVMCTPNVIIAVMGKERMTMARLRVAKTIDTYRSTVTQFVRFAIIGVTSNAIGYGLYLVVTAFGVLPAHAVTAIYITSATLAYYGNKSLTFTSNTSVWSTRARYIIAQLIGYAINIALLAVLHDYYGYSHQLVQFIAIGVVAVYLFITLKVFVFQDTQ